MLVIEMLAKVCWAQVNVLKIGIMASVSSTSASSVPRPIMSPPSSRIRFPRCYMRAKAPHLCRLPKLLGVSNRIRSLFSLGGYPDHSERDFRSGIWLCDSQGAHPHAFQALSVAQKAVDRSTQRGCTEPPFLHQNGCAGGFHGTRVLGLVILRNIW